MHRTGMFSTNNVIGQPQQQAAPAVEVYDINAIASQFAGWNFQVGQPYDQHTPQIALLTINEIQQHAIQGHPIRVGAFNILSQNAFNNPEFQDLVYTIIMRIGHGMQNNEWRSLDMAVSTVIARSVKACSSAMAATDPDFMASLRPADAAAVKENAEIWNYLLALAQGQVQYVPFNQMGTSSGLSTVNPSTQDAVSAARSLRGTNAGSFVEPVPDYAVAPGRYNNNAGAASGRYGRRAEKIYGKVEGSMQEALQQSGAAQAVQDAGTYQPRMQRPSATQASNPAPGNPQAAQAAKRFDSDVTDFSKPLENTMTPQAPAQPKPEPVKDPLFTVQIGDETVKIARERKEGVAAWKSSRVQRFHPAWCKRTHTVRYFESQDGLVIAMLQELTSEQKEIAMNYEAHAIDPTKGQPEPEVPVRPVRSEAKVLYAPADKVTVNVVLAEKFGMEEDVSGAIRSARLTAEMSNPVPDAYVKSSVVNTPVVYATEDDAMFDIVVIRAIAASKDFAEASTYLAKIRNPLARKTVNDTLVLAVNRATECELGVGVRISSFEEDGKEILPVLEKTQGALISEKMRAHQTTLLNANVRVATAEEIKSYADATMSLEDQEELDPEVAKRVLFLQRNVCSVWVNFTDNELAIGVPPKGPAVIQADSLGALHQISQKVFADAIGTLGFSEQFLVTKDNVRYRLHRGLLNKDCYLLSKEPK